MFNNKVFWLQHVWEVCILTTAWLWFWLWFVSMFFNVVGRPGGSSILLLQTLLTSCRSFVFNVFLCHQVAAEIDSGHDFRAGTGSHRQYPVLFLSRGKWGKLIVVGSLTLFTPFSLSLLYFPSISSLSSLPPLSHCLFLFSLSFSISSLSYICFLSFSPCL